MGSSLPLMVDKNLGRLQLIMLENMPKMLLAKDFTKLLPVMLTVITAVNYVYIATHNKSK